MRRIAYLAAAAAAVIATPAYADESRVEVRGGVVWCCGESEDTLGIAVGRDFDLGETVFIGAEAVLDSNFDFNTPIAGVNARLGTKLGEQTKLFGLVGYAHDTDSSADDVVLGAGLQHNLGEKFMVSVQYQRALDSELNRAFIGLGLRF